MKISLNTRLASLLLIESKTITFLLGIIGLLLGLGFLFAEAEGNDYVAILQLGSEQTWGIAFILYGLLKLYQSIFHISNTLKVIVSSLGMWLWAYILIAFLFVDTANITPAEILLLVPLLCELIELIIDVFHCKNKRLKKSETSV